MSLPPRFISYAESLGVKLLKDDIKFLEKQIIKYPSGLRRELLRDYLAEYVKVLGSESEGCTESNRQNRARFTTNTKLRKGELARR